MPSDGPFSRMSAAVREKVNDAMDELLSRFILNCPDEDWEEPERLFFHVEQAFWHYLDFYVEADSTLPKCGMKDFAVFLFERAPNLRRFRAKVEDMYNAFLMYKSKVPVYGAILLDPSLTHALMVRGFKSKSTWSFPRGKVNEAENEWDCAVREVWEETGCDCSPFLSQEYSEKVYQGQKIRLYFGLGVPLETAFAPVARNEVGGVEWHELRGLYKEEKLHGPVPFSKKYYMVLPFLSDLRKWVAKKGIGKEGPKGGSSGGPRSVSEPRLGGKGGREGKEKKEAGMGKVDTATFGKGNGEGWSAEEMFRVNEDKFNVKSSYDYESYTTPLSVPSTTEEAKKKKGEKSKKTADDRSVSAQPSTVKVVGKGVDRVKVTGVSDGKKAASKSTKEKDTKKEKKAVPAAPSVPNSASAHPFAFVLDGEAVMREVHVALGL
mmetsp:Transcript_10510/g.27521  ORF Transcript_10510/g.27521 Transcript_10510/m.27521 type:complete len:435 (-) Transcript_10510:868-2172(-)